MITATSLCITLAHVILTIGAAAIIMAGFIIISAALSSPRASIKRRLVVFAFGLIIVLLGATGAGLSANAATISGIPRTSYWLDVMTVSQHFPDRGFNQSNPGIGIEADTGNWQFAVGTYRNSYYRTTNYAMLGYLPLHVGGWSAGVVGGPATGYEFPVIGGFEFAYRRDTWGVNVLAVPPVMKGSAVIGLQLVMRLP